MVGAGVLAMPYTVGNLGWVGGPIAIAFFCMVQVRLGLGCVGVKYRDPCRRAAHPTQPTHPPAGGLFAAAEQCVQGRRRVPPPLL
jgi:hypothetical protein